MGYQYGFDALDAAQLAVSISELLDDDMRLSEMKKNAFNVSNTMTWDSAAKKIIDFLKNEGVLAR